MPVYIYKNDRGDTVELVRSVNDRNQAPKGFERVTVPQKIYTHSGAPSPTDIKSNILKGYYREECRSGSRRTSKYTPKQIKAAWRE
jgi:hypothetical protein